MAAKIALVLSLCFAGFVLGAPSHPKPKTEGELVDAFVKFLHEDKELSGAMLALGSPSGRSSPSRNKRQVEEDAEMLPETTEIDGNAAPEAPKKPGFIDRVLVMAMELLQRFLKWLNTEDN